MTLKRRVYPTTHSVGHLVECVGHLAELVAALETNARAKIALTERAGCTGDARERPTEPSRRGGGPERDEREDDWKRDQVIAREKQGSGAL